MRILGLFCAALAAVLAVGLAGDPASARQAGKPNIIYVMSDDQAAWQMSYMPKTVSLVGDRGVTYTHYFGTFPLCCPARVSIQTGQYPHNHGVTTNVDAFGRWKDKQNTLPVAMEAAGYQTAYLGKYVFGFKPCSTTVPPGWDPAEWHATGSGRYYGMVMHNPSGKCIQYGEASGRNDPADYSTDVSAGVAVDILERLLPGDKPVFAMLNFDAPHIGGPLRAGEPTHCSVPPERYRGQADTIPFPDRPSFNEQDLSDKPNQLQLPKMSEARIDDTVYCFHRKVETMMGLDDAVERIVDAVEASGEADNTYIVYATDNGFMTGEHRDPDGKGTPYTEAVQLPLMIRGPGIGAGTTDDDLRSEVDLTATFLQWAGATMPGHPLDGKPLDAAPRDDLLIEGKTWSALRTPDFYYVKWNGSSAEQLYDLRNDPWEMESVHADAAYASTRDALRGRLAEVADCVGSACP